MSTATGKALNHDVALAKVGQPAPDFNLPSTKKLYHLQAGVGHYGVFNGSRFRAQIAPRIVEFIENHNGEPARKKPSRA